MGDWRFINEDGIEDRSYNFESKEDLMDYIKENIIEIISSIDREFVTEDKGYSQIEEKKPVTVEDYFKQFRS